MPLWKRWLIAVLVLPFVVPIVGVAVGYVLDCLTQ